jgi:hypothetical protein
MIVQPHRPSTQPTKTPEFKPATMLRRPPTVIPLTDDDLQFHLQRTFARSLPVNINHLSLEDADQNYAERDPDPTSEEQHSSLNKPAGQLDQQRPLHGSTGGMTHSSLIAARMHPAALPASMMTGSTHRTIVDPNRAPTAAATAQLISSNNIPQTRASRLREASPSPPRTELTIPPQEFLDRHILPSPGRKKGPSSAIPRRQTFQGDDHYLSAKHKVTDQALAQKITVVAIPRMHGPL